MPAKVSLSEFVAALQFGEPTEVRFLDRGTGKIVPAHEEIEQVGERLPALTDQQELHFAREFIATVKDPGDRQRLELALASGNAQEAFERTVFRCQIANEWYQYRDRCLEQFAKDWLDARGLPYTDDVSHSAE